MGLEQSFSSMKAAIIVLAVVHLISGATYKETRKVTDSSGDKFSCKYSIFYNSKTVVKAKSSVTCTPNKNGKAISEIFVIESLGKSVTLKHAIKKGKDTISAVSLEDYVAPTTSAPAPASGEAMDCSCKLPGMDYTEIGQSGIPFQLMGESDSDRKILKPAALTRGKGGGHGGHHGGYHGGYHGHHTGVSKPSLSSIIPLALTAILAGLLAFGGTTLLNLLLQTTVNIIGRSLPVDELAQAEDSQARLLAKLNDRQLLGNLLGNIQPLPVPAPAPAPANPLLGILGGSNGGGLDLGTLLGAAGSSSGPNDMVNQIAMQVVQQQIEDFINSGAAEAAVTDFIESGKMEELMNSMMESVIENNDTEELVANIQSNLEENLGEVNGEFEEFMNEQNIEQMMEGFKLEDILGSMNITELINGMDLDTMEMQMQCSCMPSSG